MFARNLPAWVRRQSFSEAEEAELVGPKSCSLLSMIERSRRSNFEGKHAVFPKWEVGSWAKLHVKSLAPLVDAGRGMRQFVGIRRVSQP